MNFSVETVNRLLASFRGYAQYAVGMATMFGILNAANGKQITDAFNEVATGVQQVFHGGQTLWVVLFPIVSVALARWSSATAKTSNQAAQVQAAVKDPNSEVAPEAKASLLDATANLDVVKKDAPIVVTDPKLAQAVPASNVVAG